MLQSKLIIVIIFLFGLYKWVVISNDLLKYHIAEASPFDKNSGIVQSLPPEAQITMQLISELGVPNFKLSDEIFNKIYEQQRIIESAYPIRFNSNSKYIFAYDYEPVDIIKYRAIGKQKNIILYEKN